MRQSPLAPESPSEEHLGRGDVSLGAKQNIDGLSLFVDGTIEIGPATLDFDVRFRRRARTGPPGEQSGSSAFRSNSGA